MLKQIKMYDRALDDFRHAARDLQYAGKAHAQLALCFRAMGRHEDAATAFREALTAPMLSSEETVHLLYLLGQTLDRSAAMRKRWRLMAGSDKRTPGSGT